MEELGEILLGTYEDFIVGYRILEIPKTKSNKTNSKRGESENDNIHSFDQSFAVRCHSGSVKCLATNSKGNLAITSGNDEMVNLLSLKKRKLLHTIEVAANCAVFALESHIIFGSQDGNIYVYEYHSSSMELAKILGGHKGPVTSLSVHPSGKILLSLSTDGTMRTWNLIKGRPVYTTNFKKAANLVSWSKSGDIFVISEGKELYCFDLSGKLRNNFTIDKRINSIDFIDDKILVVAPESGYLEFIDLENDIPLLRHEAHETRIKSVKLLLSNDSHSSDGSDDETHYTRNPIKSVTSSSDGTVKLWSFNLVDNDETGRKIDNLKELTNTDTGSRITCMALANFTN